MTGELAPASCPHVAEFQACSSEPAPQGRFSLARDCPLRDVAVNGPAAGHLRHTLVCRVGAVSCAGMAGTARGLSSMAEGRGCQPAGDEIPGRWRAWTRTVLGGGPGWPCWGHPESALASCSQVWEKGMWPDLVKFPAL